MAKFGVSEGMILSAATAEGKLKLLDVTQAHSPGIKWAKYQILRRNHVKPFRTGT